MNKELILRWSTILLTVSTLVIPSACKKSKGSGTTTAPIAITNSASWVGRRWATLKGSVNAKNFDAVISFQWDTTNVYSHVVHPDPDTTSADYGVVFSYALTDLKPEKQYHFRISAISEGGSSNGSDVTFKTTDTNGITIKFNPALTYDSIYDFEGNTYKTIAIGTQTWMAENLRSTKLNDGTDIPFTQDTYKWAALTTPGYSWYAGDSVGWGAIYNWNAVNSGKLCPDGWHVPSDEEWTTLTDYLGGSAVAGGKMKEFESNHWITPNAGATNESGFTALPTGYRTSSGGYSNMGHYGYWWTSTEWTSSGAWYRDVFHGYESVDRSNANKKDGMPVRCTKD